MTVLLIEPILDRYVAQAERREKDWSPKEVEALLLKLRKEIGLPQVIDGFRTTLIYRLRTSERVSELWKLPRLTI